MLEYLVSSDSWRTCVEMCLIDSVCDYSIHEHVNFIAIRTEVCEVGRQYGFNTAYLLHSDGREYTPNDGPLIALENQLLLHQVIPLYLR